MKKKYIYIIIISIVVLASSVAIAENIMTQQQKDEAAKKEWSEQHKNAKDTYTNEQLEKMREQDKINKQATQDAWNKRQSEEDQIDKESQKILTKYYKKDINILIPSDEEQLKAFNLILDILNNKENGLSATEIANLKKSLGRRFELTSDHSELKESFSKAMGYDSTESNNITPIDISPSPSLSSPIPKLKAK